MSDLRAPFPWFGGKSRVAADVWQRFGDVANYTEPFAGSLAVLLDRSAHHERPMETVNDLDGYIANFWRALQADPDGVARYADWPVNENDLTARHLWLVNEGRDRVARLEADPDYYDVKVAGWWVWGLCVWIGSGWCSGDGPWTAVDGRLERKQAGQGINRQRPHVSDAGQGIHRANQPLYDYMQGLADRLRRVRVCCGDWSRVVTDGALANGSTVGIFLDPPYALGERNDTLYRADAEGIAVQVREWAIANGDNPRYRIALCGYDGEHEMPGNWDMLEWKAHGGYSSFANGTRAQDNVHRERIWFSPACLSIQRQISLLDF